MKSNYETLVSLSECWSPPWSACGHLQFRTTPGSARLWALGRLWQVEKWGGLQVLSCKGFWKGRSVVSFFSVVMYLLTNATCALDGNLARGPHAVSDAHGHHWMTNLLFSGLRPAAQASQGFSWAFGWNYSRWWSQHCLCFVLVRTAA